MPDERTALRVLDMFNRFNFPDRQALAKAAHRITPAIHRLRRPFDRAGAPVVHVTDNFTNWRGDFVDMVAGCLAVGGIPAWIATRLALEPWHYYIRSSSTKGCRLDPAAC